MIAETLSFELGRFTVWQKPRFDNPAWAVYLVYCRDKFIGKSFSRPDVDCCKWLERQSHTHLPIYALPEQSQAWKKRELRGVTKSQQRKPPSWAA